MREEREREKEVREGGRREERRRIEGGVNKVRERV